MTPYSSRYFDLVRALSAFAVVYCYARVLFFASADKVGPLHAINKGLYILSGFGHSAVVAFFVLSGYFISSSIRRDVQWGNWSWKRYLTNRGVRLYMVLIPGLVATVFWDQVGLALVAPAGSANNDSAAVRR